MTLQIKLGLERSEIDEVSWSKLLIFTLAIRPDRPGARTEMRRIQGILGAGIFTDFVAGFTAKTWVQ